MRGIVEKGRVLVGVAAAIAVPTNAIIVGLHESRASAAPPAAIGRSNPVSEHKGSPALNLRTPDSRQAVKTTTHKPGSVPSAHKEDPTHTARHRRHAGSHPETVYQVGDTVSQWPAGTMIEPDITGTGGNGQFPPDAPASPVTQGSPCRIVGVGHAVGHELILNTPGDGSNTGVFKEYNTLNPNEFTGQVYVIKGGWGDNLLFVGNGNSK